MGNNIFFIDFGKLRGDNLKQILVSRMNQFSIEVDKYVHTALGKGGGIS